MLPVIPGSDETGSVLLIRGDDSRADLEGFRWPEDHEQLDSGDQVVIRYGLNPHDHKLAVVLTIGIGGPRDVVDLEIAVPVAELMSYSENDRDAFFRADALARFYLREDIARSFRVMTEHAGEKPWPEGLDSDIGPLLPLETSRKRATRLFYEWASGAASHGEFDFVVASGQVPILRVGSGSSIRRYEVPLSLFDGAALRDLDSGDTRGGQALVEELRLLRRSWMYRRGLSDVRSEFGDPTVRMGGFDFTETRLSSLENIRDQWFYSDLLEDYGVLFREYASGRLAVNVFDRSSG
jgi:hypothetical protein